MQVDDVEIGTKCELGWDRAGEAVGGEVEDGEVDERLEIRGDLAR